MIYKTPRPIGIIAGQLVVGGAERQLFLWLSHLDREKYQPVVLSLHPNCKDHWEEPIRQLSIPLIFVPHRRSRLIRLLDIIRILKPYKPVLIHGWHLFASPYAGLAAMVLGAKSLGNHRDSYRIFQQKKLEATLTMHTVDALLVNSSWVANSIKNSRRGSKPLIYSVQNAVEEQKTERTEKRNEISKRFGLDPTRFWLGSLGRLDPKKRFDLLLKSIALLAKDFSDFHFLMIGEGPDRHALENLADSLGIRRFITFAGEIPGASAWLPAMDIFCFTSLDEGLPNVLMEAGVAGVPVVAWRLPFVEELLTSEMACLVEPDAPRSFADGILALIRSPERREEISHSVRKHMVENFTLPRYLKRMNDVYEQVMGISQLTRSDER